MHAEEFGKAGVTLDSSKRNRYVIEDKVSDPHIVQRAPIFDNAPFLKLRKGDKLVRAKGWSKGGKGEKPQVNEFESYFLLNGGKYYRLDWGGVQRNKKPVLLSADQSLLFDWDVSLANAKLLVKIDKNQFGESIIAKKFVNLKNALRKDFPNTLRDVGFVKINAPRLQGKGKTRRVIFQGLNFSRFTKTVFQYQLEVGNGIQIYYSKKLIVGPRRVLPEEFEAYKGNGYPNDRGSYTPDPARAAKARAAFNRMEKFRAIVNKFLAQPPWGEG